MLALAALLLAAPLAAQTVFVDPPDAHRPVVEAVAAARSSVDMTMYHLTDPSVVDALRRAAARGVAVRVILDGASLSEPRFSAPARALEASGVQVRASSPAFSITHEKALVVDRATALIMSMNMTKDYWETRDYGVVSGDPGVIAEWERVFAADWADAQTGGRATPKLSEASLLWSPGNSGTKLAALIGSARSELLVTTENLGDRGIQKALLAAAARGARVRLLAPMCDLNKDPLYNYRFLRKLSAGGVEARVMPSPSSAQAPYMHAKSIVADGARAYVGSINLSANSIRHARELGILLAQPGAVSTIANTFEQDWRAAVPVPNPAPRNCPGLD